MKKFLVLLACALFVLTFAFGCGQKSETEGTDDVSAGGAVEEMADTTRMDSAEMDTAAMDTMAEEGTEGGEEMEGEEEAAAEEGSAGGQ
jgi:hypothetical protein